MKPWMTLPLLLLAGALCLAIPSGAAPPDRLPPPVPVFQYQGVGACSATACHGGPAGARGGEYQTWASRDPHARAYSVLFDDRSRRIVRNLHDPDDPAEPVPAHENQSCLACHAMPAAPAERGPGFSLADGVGCEACHGPAQEWLTKHYLPGWKDLTTQQKIDLGFQDTRDLVHRGQSCLDCHVGSARAEVDHDLIAAGHPRLNFELASYHSLMPRHWSYREDLERHPDLQARLWELGQVLSARASLALLAHRAERGPERWPELAEQDCYACHRGLHAESGHRAAGGVPGRLKPNTWYRSSLPAALGLLGADAPPELVELEREMSLPLPDRGRAASLARAVGGQLQAIEVSREVSPLEARQGLRRLAAFSTPTLDQDWDQAAQCYLALAAFHNACTDHGFRQPRTAEGLRTMRQALRFPPVPGGERDSPAPGSAGRFAELLKAFSSRID